MEDSLGASQLRSHPTLTLTHSDGSAFLQHGESVLSGAGNEGVCVLMRPN